MSGIPMKSLDPESDEEDQEMNEMIDSLKTHLKECQKKGKYVEAQMAQNRIAELKEKKSERKMTKLHTAGEKEIKIMADTHSKEMQILEDKWAQTFEEFDAEWQEKEKALQEKHEQELEKQRTEVEAKISVKSHVSLEIVKLKSREEALAKQGK